MKSLKQYHIPFTGLKTGKHQFDFDVDELFFNEFEYSLVKKGRLKVNLDLDKQATMLILDFSIAGEIYLSCDVCLADFPTPVNITERQIVKFGEEDIDETEEIMVLNRNEHEIDVSGLIYEFINLATPYISRCENEGKTPWCDMEMVEKLKALSEKEAINTGDPRWEALKKIKNN
ncbi:DUF177 domain-containing protein (plasmid) [Pedobacter sp. BS3]|uniref:YceD family protein n=1 Tax=Pedobacter sp. BS3 TaxID=2567937 RepID=UPI0011EEF3A7|nr:DUF177 domain-containing protein [Pedobacter sp. BS3]TZF85585.1 DUF177 domain-containing protein [Pedobacter sp. BS3]